MGMGGRGMMGGMGMGGGMMGGRGGMGGMMFNFAGATRPVHMVSAQVPLALRGGGGIFRPIPNTRPAPVEQMVLRGRTPRLGTERQSLRNGRTPRR